jgi:hypothetical protein
MASSIGSIEKEDGMEDLGIRRTISWKIVVAWVIVLAPVVWAIYYTLASSLKLIAH